METDRYSISIPSHRCGAAEYCPALFMNQQIDQSFDLMMNVLVCD